MSLSSFAEVLQEDVRAGRRGVSADGFQCQDKRPLQSRGAPAAQLVEVPAARTPIGGAASTARQRQGSGLKALPQVRNDVSKEDLLTFYHKRINYNV